MPWWVVEPELEFHHLTREHRLCRKHCSESVGKPGGEWRIVSMTRCDIGVDIGASGITILQCLGLIHPDLSKNPAFPSMFFLRIDYSACCNFDAREMVIFQLLFNLPQLSEIIEADLPNSRVKNL
jgi:hypothetical protein